MALRLSAKLETTVTDILFGMAYGRTNDATEWPNEAPSALMAILQADTKSPVK